MLFDLKYNITKSSGVKKESGLSSSCLQQKTIFQNFDSSFYFVTIIMCLFSDETSFNTIKSKSFVILTSALLSHKLICN